MNVPKSALVLAAGFGTRLRPLTDHQPKALIEVGGRPMIEFPLRMLSAAGVRRVVVNLHHLGDAVRDALGDGSRFGLSIRYSPEDPILDTGGAIARARSLLGDGPFFVANCDALVDVDLTALIDLHLQSAALATLVVRTDPQAERYGPVDHDERGRIRRFLGRPPDVEDRGLTRTMFCGVHLLSPAIFEHMPAATAFSITRDVYRSAVEAGAPLYAFPYSGYWRDLGTPDAVEAARFDLASGRFAPPYLSIRVRPEGFS